VDCSRRESAATAASPTSRRGSQQLGGLEGFGGIRTYVIGLQLLSGPARDRLAQLAHDTGGEYYGVRDGGELQAALAAIDALLRGESALSTTVAPSPGVVPQAQPAAAGEAVAKVTRANASVNFSTVARTSASRRLQKARMVISWNSGKSRFRLSRLQFRKGRSVKVNVTRRQLQRALRGRWAHLARGLQIRGRTGRTFIVLEMRTRGSGRRAAAAAEGWGVNSRARRFQGSKATVLRSRWTFQRRPN
jgi:hypothetical protein